MNKMSNSVNVTLRHDQLKEVKNSIKADKPASGFIEKQRNDKPKQKKELPPDYTQAVTVDRSLIIFLLTTIILEYINVLMF